MDIQVHEAFRTPNTHNQKRTSPHHIIVKRPRVKKKERILKAARKMYHIKYNGKPIRILSVEILKDSRAWTLEFQALTQNNSQKRLLYPAIIL
jgi:hypothetical protein